MPLKTTAGNHGQVAKGRGATINPEGRFENFGRESFDDEWFQEPPEGEAAKPKTVIAIEHAKSVISRHNSPDVGFAQSLNPYRGCSHGCTYCLHGDTRILLVSGRTKAMSDLRIGDEIYGTTFDGRTRRYTKTLVLDHWSSVKPAYRTVLDGGTELVTSGDHRFLSDGGWKHVTGEQSGPSQRPFLTTNDQLLGPGRLAGGPMQRAEDCRGGSGGSMTVTRTLNLERRAVKSDARLKVVSIEPLGKAMRLYDITTGTGDFIANGVVSHNCFARPSHAYLGLSPGLDFETRLSVKVNAAERLREEIAKPGYRCEVLTIGVNTDAYQPIEREHRITRSVLEVCSATNHPVSLITKSALVERDLDLLAPMARKNLVHVTISITTLDHAISRHMEPRTSAPARRLLAVKRLAEAGIPVNVNIAPVIPFLTDHELEPIMEAAVAAGAVSAFYNLVRLPWEVKDIFRAWLETHFPLKAAHVMSRIHEMREGRDNDPNFGTRMTGTGLFAELLRQRYQKACKRFGLDKREEPALDCGLFKPPSLHGQKDLF